ncbi:hypothetical protein [Cupriavidus sp. USMAHM13]|uniref:hypothetical protein n=1 Tax=Cupriavidus sp. USMAHM13 TaxID=1389192 RepID=UPI0012EA002D|nr:hypothetical protein [Cupriavidus sp. USMAHM13]
MAENTERHVARSSGNGSARRLPAHARHAKKLSRLVFPSFLEFLATRADQAIYPFVVGGLAFVATLSMCVPVAPLVAASVLLSARRWKALALCAAVGSGAAALVLYVVFHDLGWEKLLGYLPELTRSARWVQIAAYTEDYGLLALVAIAASPLPQTPALVFVALAELSPLAVFGSILGGKLAKYGVVAWLAARARDPLQGEIVEMMTSMGRNKVPHGRRHDST